jgi:hypothetical protein
MIFKNLVPAAEKHSTSPLRRLMQFKEINCCLLWESYEMHKYKLQELLIVKAGRTPTYHFAVKS